MNKNNRVTSKLDTYLREHGIKKSWLAEKIDASRSQVTRWSTNDENGIAVSTPNMVYVIRIEKVLGCKMSDLFEEL